MIKGNFNRYNKIEMNSNLKYKDFRENVPMEIIEPNDNKKNNKSNRNNNNENYSPYSLNNANTNSDSKDKSEEPLFIMTVELEKGNAEYINIHLDSHPEELAFDFCKNHNLDISSYSYLANEIKKLLLNLRSQNLEKQESNQNSNKEGNCIRELEEEELNSEDFRIPQVNDEKNFKAKSGNTSKSNPNNMIVNNRNSNNAHSSSNNKNNNNLVISSNVEENNNNNNNTRNVVTSKSIESKDLIVHDHDFNMPHYKKELGNQQHISQYTQYKLPGLKLR